MKINQIDEQIAAAKSLIQNLKRERGRELIRLRQKRKDAAKYKIGDVIDYGVTRINESRPLLITQVTYDSHGKASYGGLFISRGKLTASWGNTGFWHHSENRMKKVGHANDMTFCPNAKLTPLPGAAVVERKGKYE